MRTLGPSRSLAGVAVSLPLLALLLGSIVQVALDGDPSLANARLRALALGLTVVFTVLAALISALSRWIPAPTSRAVMAVCGGIAATGASFVATATGGGSFWVAVPVIGLAWAWVVASVHGAQRLDLESVLERIPERDRLWGVEGPTSGQDSRYAAGSATGIASASGFATPEDTHLWTVQIASRRMARLSVFGVVTFAAIVILSLGVTPTWWLIVVAMLGVGFCALTAAWARIEVQIDESGVRVRSQVLRLQLLTVPPREILGVSSAEVDPMVYGGWGLRWNSRHTAFIVTGGPGLVVYRAGGRSLAIETPDGSDCADQGAQAVRAAVAAARQA
ncbi:hypothetical protein BH23ACT6_BH23ACT6_12140 [soil metagenome]